MERPPLTGIWAAHLYTPGKLQVECNYIDGWGKESGWTWKLDFDLCDILGGSDREITIGGAGFFSTNFICSLLEPSKDLIMEYKEQGGSPHSDSDSDSNSGKVHKFDLKQLFHFDWSPSRSAITLKPLAELQALDPNRRLFPKKLFYGQQIASDGILTLFMHDVQGSPGPKGSIARQFELDKVLGLVNRRLTIGQTGFFSKGLTKSIHLDSDDPWKMYYKVYLVDSQNDWSDYKSYDLSQLFYLDDRLRLKGHPEMGDAHTAYSTTPEHTSAEKKPYASTANARQAPPKYQLNADASNFDLSSIKKALDFAMREADGLKNDASLNERRHRIEVDELKSKLRTARSIARDKISSLKHTIRCLREQLEEDDHEDDESGEDEDED